VPVGSISERQSFDARQRLTLESLEERDAAAKVGVVVIFWKYRAWFLFPFESGSPSPAFQAAYECSPNPLGCRVY